MPRFRSMRRSFRRPMRAPIVSFKHQHSQLTSYVGGNADQLFVINVGSAQAVPVSPNTTPLGNKQYSVDLTVSFVNGSANTATDYSWMLIHLRSSQDLAGLGFVLPSSNWSSIGLAEGKNQVIESHMGTMSTEDGSQLLFQRHIKIPKQWHRMREGDQLVLVWNSAQGGITAFGARWKSYS